MKYNNFLITLTLFAALQPGISFCSQTPQKKDPQGYWQRYAPEFMQSGTRYISEKATGLYNTVNSWSMKKKLLVLSAILTTLGVSAYKINQIMSDIPVNNLKKSDNIASILDSYPDFDISNLNKITPIETDVNSFKKELDLWKKLKIKSEEAIARGNIDPYHGTSLDNNERVWSNRLHSVMNFFVNSPEAREDLVGLWNQAKKDVVNYLNEAHIPISDTTLLNESK